MNNYKTISKQLLDSHSAFELIDYINMNISYKGIYGISIDSLENFEIFDSIPRIEEIYNHIESISISNNLLYVGSAIKSNSSIGDRLFGHQLGGKLMYQNPSTFRAIFYRKLGSVLGFKSSNPQKNFRFNSSDDILIREWIQKHLKVKYFEMNDESIDIYQTEIKLINQMSPPFNYQHNPNKCDAITSIYRMNNQNRNN